MPASLPAIALGPRCPADRSTEWVGLLIHPMPWYAANPHTSPKRKNVPPVRMHFKRIGPSLVRSSALSRPMYRLCHQRSTRSPKRYPTSVQNSRSLQSSNERPKLEATRVTSSPSGIRMARSCTNPIPIQHRFNDRRSRYPNHLRTTGRWEIRHHQRTVQPASLLR